MHPASTKLLCYNTCDPRHTPAESLTVRASRNWLTARPLVMHKLHCMWPVLRFGVFSCVTRACLAGSPKNLAPSSYLLVTKPLELDNKLCYAIQTWSAGPLWTVEKGVTCTWFLNLRNITFTHFSHNVHSLQLTVPSIHWMISIKVTFIH